MVSEDGKNLVLRGGVTQLAARHVPTEDLLIRNLVRLIRQRISFYGSWVIVLEDEWQRPLAYFYLNMVMGVFFRRFYYVRYPTSDNFLAPDLLPALPYGTLTQSSFTAFLSIFLLIMRRYVAVPLDLNKHILSWQFCPQQVWLLAVFCGAVSSRLGL